MDITRNLLSLRKVRDAPIWIPYHFLSISNGLAKFQALPSFYFQGNVTPQGTMSMRSSGGQTFEGQIDPHFVLDAKMFRPKLFL